MADFVLARLEYGHVVVDDGILRARRFELEHDPCLLAACKLALINIIPAVTLVILEEDEMLQISADTWQLILLSFYRILCS